MDRKLQILTYWNAGMNALDVAEQVGVTIHVVRGVLARFQRHFMPMRQPRAWVAKTAKDEDIQADWNAGLNTAEIARRYGLKELVIASRITRMRDSGTFMRPGSPSTGGVVAHNSRKARAAKLQALAAERAGELILPMRASLPPAPAGRNLPIWELEHDDCRYATSHDGDSHLFCAEPVKPGSSYCDGHHKWCRLSIKDWRLEYGKAA